ncbi:lipoate--protein ligase family protein [Halostella sp. JP-L12]|uniref:lipoate--protein ligase family protein n=1 Tax=Halostella TaxID=1843185 RepID=UPI000EF83826|nr:MULTISPECIES: biotin/lipoate A/B protein ligase family protein [Halostella]NHN47918.1 lipoate--protein ligase family protein [Halostella sp. JP-L12]
MADDSGSLRSSLADRDWRFVSEESRSGAMNMALDEIAAETASSGGPRTVRVYRWDPSCLSLGYRQDPETVDWAYCKRKGIDVVRRQTGGGGIYHDNVGDISYSVVAPADELPGDLLDCYSLLCEPVVEAFRRMGVFAEFADEDLPAIHEPACYLRAVNPAHDLVCGGRKISGNAQYHQRDAVIQHGSLNFDLTIPDHLGVFSNPETTDEEFEGRVTSITNHADVTREEAVETLEECLREWADARTGGWTDQEIDDARLRAERKYESEAWNRHRDDPT